MPISRKSKGYAEAYGRQYVAQETPQIDTEIDKKDHVWMETKLGNPGCTEGVSKWLKP